MNPIIAGRGVCDPHIHIFGNKAYLFASHDSSCENTTWLMNDWQIWSSEDLMSWNYECTVRPEDTYIGPCNRCWAVDAAEKNGKYYYYFSNGNKDTGVAVSDMPHGPYKDALGKPLLKENLTRSLQYDPTVFVDSDDEIPYLIWGCGQGEGYYIARLNEDMISLAEEPRQILIDGKSAWDDKSFMHKKNGKYYLSWGSFYAISDCVYGPYTYCGSLGISEDHGSFFSWNGQDFYAFTIFDPTNFYRATGLCYIHYTADGRMKADQMIAEYGVGCYNSDWNKIQAEWYMRGNNIRKMENIWGGFDVGEISSKSELYYPNISGLNNKKRIHFLVSSVTDKSEIVILDQKSGSVLGTCPVSSTGGHTHEGYRIFSCDLSKENGRDTTDIMLKFRGEGNELMRIHWFRFT